MGCNVSICSEVSDLALDIDVVILSKSDQTKALAYKERTNALVGAINTSNIANKNNNIDFVIVGSPEERISLLPKYNNVFIVNLIEQMHNRDYVKVHKNSITPLTVGIHGSYTHTSKMSYGFAPAIEEINKKRPNTFRILSVSNQPSKVADMFAKMKISKTPIECRAWSYSTFIKDLEKMDIGVVCNSTDLMQMHPNIDDISDTDLGLYKSDYAMRFKNKSNPGRTFVFYQAGIPVIADLTPSHFPMLFDSECGFLADNKESWIHALNTLTNAQVRQNTAKKAKDRFLNLYSMEKDATKLIEEIKDLINDKNK